MDTKLSRGKEPFAQSIDEYRASLKKHIQTEVQSVIDEEIRKAARDLMEEQRNAIRGAVEEHKLLIRQVVEEEKAAIHERVDDLRRSIMRLGSA